MNAHEALEKLKPSFQYFDEKTGNFKKLGGTAVWQAQVLAPKFGGGFIHLERAKDVNDDGRKVDYHMETARDIAPLRKYIADNLRLLATKAIDLYFACKEADERNGNSEKLDAFFSHLLDPGACIEDQGLHLVQFEDEHLVDHSNAVSAGDAADLEKIVKAADNAAAGIMPLADKLLDDEINFLSFKYDGPGAKTFRESEDWKDFSSTVKDRLLPKGQPAPMVAVVKAVRKSGSDAYEFRPVMKNGRQVIRPLTAEYIDEIGPACLANVTAI